MYSPYCTYVKEKLLSENSARQNRRSDLVDAALEAFVDRGYEGTTISELAAATDLSKAAFVYHFASKEELLFELSTPLLDDLDQVVSHYESRPSDPDSLLEDYLDVLCRHHRVASWIDGDKSILNHGDLGARLEANNERVHGLLAGPKPGAAKQAQASAVLGMLWRPIRNGYLTSGSRNRSAIAKMAGAAAAAL